MKFIQFYREKRGLTQAQLAEAVGVQESDIVAYESTQGDSALHLDTAIIIARELGVTLAELVKGPLS